MILFSEYLQVLESTADLKNVLPDEKVTKLLKTPKDKTVSSLHDSVFGKGNHHIELPIHNPVPDSVKDHVTKQGDTINDDHTVKLKSGRNVALSKYLPRSKASPEVTKAHENWARNKTNHETKLVISRHPGEVASCSTGTKWDSCANLDPTQPVHGGKGDAAKKIPGEIKHGTLIAMHMHKDAKPNANGEYDSKHVLGRSLIKRYDDETGHTSFHQEGKMYGKFPESAEKEVNKFTKKHYPQTGFIATKHKSIYDDDENTNKIDRNATSEQLHKALVSDDDTIKELAIRHPNITADHITKVLDKPGLSYTKLLALRHKNVTPEHITKALDSPEKDVRENAIQHPNATVDHITKALKDSNDYVRYAAIQHPKATPEHIETALKDPVGFIRKAAANHPNATPEQNQRIPDSKPPF